MKKAILAVFLIIGLCFTHGMALAAQAAITATPAELASGGKVKLVFHVVNDSPFYEMRDISITGNGISYVAPNTTIIAPGGSVDIELVDFHVTTAMLGVPISFQLGWSENFLQQSQTISMVINPITGSLEGSHKASKTAAAIGEAIKFTYTLQNKTAYEITGITIKDPNISSTELVKDAKMAPGEKKEYTHTYTMVAGGVVSSPVITYILGGQSQELKLANLELKQVLAKVDLTVTAGSPTPEGTEFIIQLKNTGNQNLNRMNLRDELGDKVNDNTFSLDVNQGQTFTYLVKTSALRNVSFTLTGTDEQGSAYETTVGPYEAKPYVDPSLVNITLVPMVVEQLSESGSIQLQFTIKNGSTVDLNNAIITETTLGQVLAIGDLPFGEKTETVVLQLTGPMELNFTLIAADPSGATHEATAKATASYVSLATPAPPSPSPTQDSGEEALGDATRSTLIAVFIVLGVLIVLAVIALIALSIYEKKNEKRLHTDDGLEAFKSGTPRTGYRVESGLQEEQTRKERETKGKPWRDKRYPAKQPKEAGDGLDAKEGAELRQPATKQEFEQRQPQQSWRFGQQPPPARFRQDPKPMQAPPVAGQRLQPLPTQQRPEHIDPQEVDPEQLKIKPGYSFERPFWPPTESAKVQQPSPVEGASNRPDVQSGSTPQDPISTQDQQPQQPSPKQPEPKREGGRRMTVNRPQGTISTPSPQRTSIRRIESFQQEEE